MVEVTLEASPRAAKKWRVRFADGETVDFGAAGYQDFTQHGDPKRRASYIARHAPREDWALSGVKTAGYWSRWLLWEAPTIAGAIRLLAEKGVRVSKLPRVSKA